MEINKILPLGGRQTIVQWQIPPQLALWHKRLFKEQQSPKITRYNFQITIQIEIRHLNNQEYSNKDKLTNRKDKKK